VAAPEAANNSASTGSMLPMLTLGIPGSPTTAILLGGMVIWGLTPGPRLFVDQSEFVWGLIGSFYVSNLAALIVNIAFIPVFIWMLRMPFTILAPMIFVLSVVGGYAATRDMHDVWLMLIFGIGAFFLRKLDYPVAPAVLAIVLGPIAEPTLRQSLLLSSGDPIDLPDPADRRPDHGDRDHPDPAAASQVWLEQVPPYRRRPTGTAGLINTSPVSSRTGGLLRQAAFVFGCNQSGARRCVRTSIGPMSHL
jgi:hypothetical protein